ncbi:13187_t:CDS:2, partial [Funneliformis mosseae]
NVQRHDVCHDGCEPCGTIRPDYVPLSRCPTWDNVKVSHLDPSAFNVDQYMVMDYQRQNDVALTSPY